MAGIDNKSINGKGLAAMYDEHMQTVVTPMLQRMNGIEGTTPKIVTLQTAPTASTISYTVSGETVNFKIGDEVRAVDQESETGYTFYKLYNLVTEGNVTTAVWGELGGGGSLPFNIYLQGASEIDGSTQIINQGVLEEPEQESEEENESNNESNNE